MKITISLEQERRILEWMQGLNGPAPNPVESEPNGCTLTIIGTASPFGAEVVASWAGATLEVGDATVTWESI